MATATGQERGPDATAGMKWAPLVPLLMAVSAGILLDRYADLWETTTWAAMAIGAGAAAMLATTRRVAGNLAVVAAFAAIGGGWHHHRWSDRGPDDLGGIVGEDPSPAQVRGTVRDVLGIRPADRDRPGSDGPRTRFVVDIASTHDGRAWRPASGRAIVSADGNYVDLAEGESVELTGRIATVEGPLNPGEADYREYLRGQGIDLRLSVVGEGGVRLAPGSQGPGWLGRARTWCRDHLTAEMAPQTGPLATALLLGRREGVDPEVNDAFARTGTTHLLAISGLHMQALAAALILAARLVALPDRPAAIFVVVCTIGYAILVGPAPSVVRSAIMTVAFCLAVILGRMTMPANILALAGLGTLAVNPMALFDVGGQLSFLAVAALIWLVPPADEAVRQVCGAIRERVYGPGSPLDAVERQYEPTWKKELRKAGAWLVSGVIASTVVFLAAMPIVALRFHIVSPIGILLNIPLIAITTVAMLLGGLGLLLSAIWGPMGMPMTRGAGVLLDLTRQLVVWGVAQPWGHRFAAGPGWRWVIVFYATLGVAVVAETASRRRRLAMERLPEEEVQDLPEPGRYRRWAAWAAVAVWSMIGMLIAVFPPRPATAEADVLAVGHGLSVIVQAPDGRTLLYDCGRMGDPSVGRRIIAPALWSRGIGRIDEVVLSHADQDHFDGLPDLLNRFEVGSVRVPPGFGGPKNPAADRLLATIRGRGIPVVKTSSPASWEMGGIRMTVRHPPDGWFLDASDNARSLVLDVEQGDRHLLLTGDLEQIGLIEMIGGPRPEPPPDVLLAPHHGGRSANPESFYEWARPGMVVVSQRAPRAGTDALTPLERRGLDVRRTWRVGAIRLQWTDRGIVATNFLERPEVPTGDKTGALAASRWPIAMVGAWPIGLRWAAALAGLLAGLMLWAVMAMVEFGAWTLIVHPGHRRGGRDEGPEPEPIEAMANDGVRLAGRRYRVGEDREPRGTILLLHGFAEDPSAWEGARASILNAAGWDVAALVSRGYGESGGLYASFGGREAGDVSAWLDAIDRPGKGVAAWGRSMGAAIAMRAAADDPRIASLILESPMVDLDASVARLLRKRGLRLAGPMARLITRRAGWIAGVSLSRPRPVDVAGRVGCPTMIVHGADDWLVPPSEIRRLAEAFPTDPDRIEIPGAGHSNVVGTGSAEVVGRIVGFLGRAYGPVIGMPSDPAGEML